jgi:hypothetical protein
MNMSPPTSGSVSKPNKKAHEAGSRQNSVVISQKVELFVIIAVRNPDPKMNQ